MDTQRPIDHLAARATLLNRLAAWILMTLAAVHIVLFSVLALVRGYVPGWWRGELRDLSLSAPLAAGPSQAAFWASIGSIAIPVLLLGAVVESLAKAGAAVPAFLGYALAIWVLLAAIIMEPSGFPLALVAALLLVKARRLTHKSR